MTNPYKIGDVVTPTAHVVSQWSKQFTMGKEYTVVSIHDEFIRLVTDKGGKAGGWNHWDFTLVSSVVGVTVAQATAVQNTQRTARMNANKQPVPDYTTVVLADSDDSQSYDERKAAAPVCSRGQFSEGDILVYRDGTPTLTRLTVTWCTATAVVFDETYSMPFNPNEFELWSDY